MTTWDRARQAVDRWLAINYITVADWKLGIEMETIDQEWYDSLIEEIAIEFEGE